MASIPTYDSEPCILTKLCTMQASKVASLPLCEQEQSRKGFIDVGCKECPLSPPHLQDNPHTSTVWRSITSFLRGLIR